MNDGKKVLWNRRQQRFRLHSRPRRAHPHQRTRGRQQAEVQGSSHATGNNAIKTFSPIYLPK